MQKCKIHEDLRIEPILCHSLCWCAVCRISQLHQALLVCWNPSADSGLPGQVIRSSMARKRLEIPSNKAGGSWWRTEINRYWWQGHKSGPLCSHYLTSKTRLPDFPNFGSSLIGRYFYVELILSPELIYQRSKNQQLFPGALLWETFDRQTNKPGHVCT